MKEEKKMEGNFKGKKENKRSIKEKNIERNFKGKKKNKRRNERREKDGREF